MFSSGMLFGFIASLLYAAFYFILPHLLEGDAELYFLSDFYLLQSLGLASATFLNFKILEIASEKRLDFAFAYVLFPSVFIIGLGFLGIMIWGIDNKFMYLVGFYVSSLMKYTFISLYRTFNLMIITITSLMLSFVLFLFDEGWIFYEPFMFSIISLVVVFGRKLIINNVFGSSLACYRFSDLYLVFITFFASSYVFFIMKHAVDGDLDYFYILISFQAYNMVLFVTGVAEKLFLPALYDRTSSLTLGQSILYNVCLTSIMVAIFITLIESGIYESILNTVPPLESIYFFLGAAVVNSIHLPFTMRLYALRAYDKVFSATVAWVLALGLLPLFFSSPSGFALSFFVSHVVYFAVVFLVYRRRTLNECVV